MSRKVKNKEQTGSCLATVPLNVLQQKIALSMKYSIIEKLSLQIRNLKGVFLLCQCLVKKPYKVAVLHISIL